MNFFREQQARGITSGSATSRITSRSSVFRDHQQVAHVKHANVFGHKLKEFAVVLLHRLIKHVLPVDEGFAHCLFREQEDGGVAADLIFERAQLHR